MALFKVPQRNEVSEDNQNIFDNLKNSLGFVPNIYATYAYSDHALGRYMTFANGKTSLSNKEKEVVNLIVSQVNGCTYCQAAHTQIGKMNGFSDEQILEIRSGRATFDNKLDALARFTKSVAENTGKVDSEVVAEFIGAGYDKGNVVDVIVNIGEKTITNILHNVTEIPIDFDEAPALEEIANA